MTDPIRAYVAATVASGLVAKHGIDHGGLTPELIAQRSVDIADAILAECEVFAPAPIGDSGDGGPQSQPVPPTPDPSAAQE